MTVTVAVHPLARTVYRWRFLGSSSTEASTSAPIVVDVAPVVTAESAAGDAPESLVVRGALSHASAGPWVTALRESGEEAVMTIWKDRARDGEARSIRTRQNGQTRARPGIVVPSSTRRAAVSAGWSRG